MNKYKTQDGFFEDGRKLRILVCPANEGGCAYYRAIMPYNKLAELYPNVVEVRQDMNPLGLVASSGEWEQDFTFENMKWADVVLVNNISNFGGPYTARIVGKAREFGKIVQFDTDDLLTNLYKGHRLEEVYEKHGLSDITKFLYQNSQIVSVTQRKFADRIAPFCNGMIAVIKNSIDYTLPAWNVPRVAPPRKHYCRFGWAGGIHHEEDIKEFSGVPHYVNQRLGTKNCRWDFIGHPPPPEKGQKPDWQHDLWKNYMKILLRGFRGENNYGAHYAMPCDMYGQYYANMDVSLAPLQMNDFNDSKSEIKVAECGRYGIPLVASNVGCYSETIKNGITGWLIDPGAPPSDWVKILTKIGKDKKWREEMGSNLRELANEYFDVNNTVHLRFDLYEDALNTKGGKKLES